MIEFVAAQGSGIWSGPVLPAIITAFPVAWLGILQYRRAARLDKQAVVAGPDEALLRGIDGLDTMVENLTADNKEIRERERERVDDLRTQLSKCHTAYGDLKSRLSSNERHKETL